MGAYTARHAVPKHGVPWPAGLAAAATVAVGTAVLPAAVASASTLDAHQLHLLHLAQLRALGAVHSQVTGIAAYAAQFADGWYFYQYGGEGPRGFDCSGLAQTVYAHFGLRIPRTADEQAGYLHPTSAPEPGDLVFYWYGGYAYHTAIYLGSGRVVSALDYSEGIRVTPVSWPGSSYSFGTLR